MAASFAAVALVVSAAGYGLLVPSLAFAAIVIAAIIESSASGSPYVCHACGHHGVTSHTHHKAT